MEEEMELRHFLTVYFFFNGQWNWRNSTSLHSLTQCHRSIPPKLKLNLNHSLFSICPDLPMEPGSAWRWSQYKEKKLLLKWKYMTAPLTISISPLDNKWQPCFFNSTKAERIKARSGKVGESFNSFLNYVAQIQFWIIALQSLEGKDYIRPYCGAVYS